MDLITGGLVGAAPAQTAAKRRDMALAAGIGFCGPILSDADGLLRFAADPLLFIQYHRHVTHSLAFIPLGALIVAAIWWPFVRRRLPFGRIYLYAFLGYATAGLLDACTSYGTHLLWPFSEARLSFDIIAITDLFVSVPLLIGVVASAIRKSRVPAVAAFAFVLLYFGFGIVQHERAESIMRQEIARRGHDPQRLQVMPTILNLILWRTVYIAQDGMLHVDAVRASVFDEPIIYPGGALEKFDPETELAEIDPGSVLYRDVQRFLFFSGGFAARHPDHPDVIGDIRYAVRPNGLRPLWGIELDLEHPEQHTPFNRYQIADFDRWRAFWAMLKGDPAAAPLMQAGGGRRRVPGAGRRAQGTGHRAPARARQRPCCGRRAPAPRGA